MLASLVGAPGRHGCGAAVSTACPDMSAAWPTWPDIRQQRIAGIDGGQRGNMMPLECL